LTTAEKRILLWPLTLASFTLLFRWQALPVWVVLIVAHERGHVWAADRLHLRHTGYFPIPLVGGAVWIQDAPTLKEDIVVSLMGPVFGLAGSLLALTVGWLTKSTWLQSMAVVMALFNMLNLLPIGILDGGHVLRSLAFSLHKWAGTTLLVVFMLSAEWLFLTTHNWMSGCLLLVTTVDALVGLSFWWVRPSRNAPDGYCLMDRLKWWQVLVGLLAYLLALALLSLVLYFGLTHASVAQTVQWWLTGPGR
jgi:Zn-dependent protease